MTCPNCQSNINDNEICKCGFSMDMLLKAQKFSMALYNKGLLEARNRDLSNAVLSLRKSITFDKKNVTARNLLGLVYFEMGETTLAISQWVISNSLNADKNLAGKYLSIIEASAQKMESLYDAAKMYNQALTYAKQKSEDMAIIQLKKAVDLNPNYVQCYNLLTLLYIYTNQNKHALFAVTKSLEIDRSNKLANRYFLELNFKGVKVQHNVEKHVEKPVNVYTSPQIQNNKSGFGINVLIGLLLGATLTIGVMHYLVIPDRLDAKEKEIISLKSAFDSTKLSLEEEVAKLSSRISEMESINETLSSENKAFRIEKNNADAKKLLTDANALLYSDPITAYTMLIDYSVTELDVAILAELNTAKDTLKDRAGEAYFTEGRRLYNRAAYEDAKTYLNKSQELSTDSYTISEGLYLLGRIAENEGNNAIAKEYYTKLVNEYPNSARKSTAQYRAGNLN